MNDNKEMQLKKECGGEEVGSWKKEAEEERKTRAKQSIVLK